MPKYVEGDLLVRCGSSEVTAAARVVGVVGSDYDLIWLAADGSEYYSGTCPIAYIDIVFTKAPDQVDSPGLQSKGEGFESPGGRQFTLQDMVSMVVRKRGLIRRLEKDIMEIEEEMAKMT